MYDYELTNQDKRRILAGYVRNNLTTQSPFSPWFGLDLAYQDGVLCRTQFVPSANRTYQPLFPAEDVYTMDDNAIYARIMENKR